MKLHEKIVKLRRAAGMSQEEMAGRLNVSRQAVSRWELGTARPDAENTLQLSSLFRVTADYLLNDDYESDSDTPIVKESNRILQANLILIAIISQVSFLNAAMRPFESIDNPAVNLTEMIIKIVPLLASSIWMASNHRYEKDLVQRRKNTRIELFYCLIQAAIAVTGYLTHWYFAATAGLIAVTLTYIFLINPRYMSRQLTKKRDYRDYR